MADSTASALFIRCTSRGTSKLRFSIVVLFVSLSGNCRNPMGRQGLEFVTQGMQDLAVGFQSLLVDACQQRQTQLDGGHVPELVRVAVTSDGRG